MGYLAAIDIGANDVFLCQETTADACATAAGPGHRSRPLGVWIRGSIGMLGTTPLMLMNLANRLIPNPIRHPADLVRLAC